MVTTIQLNEGVKKALERMKEAKESYEDVIVKLIDENEKERKGREDFLIEGYKEMAEESLKINKEFEAIEKDFDWEWADEN